MTIVRPRSRRYFIGEIPVCLPITTAKTIGDRHTRNQSRILVRLNSCEQNSLLSLSEEIRIPSANRYFAILSVYAASTGSVWLSCLGWLLSLSTRCPVVVASSGD